MPPGVSKEMTASINDLTTGPATVSLVEGTTRRRPRASITASGGGAPGNLGAGAQPGTRSASTRAVSSRGLMGLARIPATPSMCGSEVGIDASSALSR
jgi:hypothetical protein